MVDDSEMDTPNAPYPPAFHNDGNQLLSPASNGPGQHMHQSQEPPHQQQVSNQQYPSMTQLLDQNLDWDPFGLSASMAFPSPQPYQIDQGNMRWTKPWIEKENASPSGWHSTTRLTSDYEERWGWLRRLCTFQGPVDDSGYRGKRPWTTTLNLSREFLELCLRREFSSVSAILLFNLTNWVSLLFSCIGYSFSEPCFCIIIIQIIIFSAVTQQCCFTVLHLSTPARCLYDPLYDSKYQL